jgi:hypothetical protein
LHISDFQSRPRFHPRDDTSEIVDLTLVGLAEKLYQNLDPFQFVTGGDDGRNPFEVYPPRVHFLWNQSLHNTVEKRRGLCNFFYDRYGCSLIIVLVTGIFCFVRVALASVHR